MKKERKKERKNSLASKGFDARALLLQLPI
jgi:hypothetical protein